LNLLNSKAGSLDTYLSHYIFYKINKVVLIIADVKWICPFFDTQAAVQDEVNCGRKNLID
jgi:hypothetical protein